MDKQDHSPEPWILTASGLGIGYKDTDKNSATKEIPWQIAKIFSIADGINTNEGKANARRIVACVNACAGASTGALEMVALENGNILEGIRKLKEENAELKAENDRLSAAAPKMLEALRLCHDFMHDLVTENFADEAVGIFKDNELDEAYKSMREAIVLATNDPDVVKSFVLLEKEK